jgi:hypothetical protein
MLDISEGHIKKFGKIKEDFLLKTKVPEENNWKLRTDNDIWLDVITQIMVVGGSASVDRFNKNEELKHNISYEKLVLMEDEEEIRKIINYTLREVKTRYASYDINKCKKTKALVFNFGVLKDKENGPMCLLEKLSKLQGTGSDSKKVNYLINNFSYLKSKSARDFLMELGLVKDTIALDTRVRKTLGYVGVDVPEKFISNPKLYNQTERDILDKICKPLGLSGVQFDRMLYQNYEEIMKTMI